jgi:hypothetical protein
VISYDQLTPQITVQPLGSISMSELQSRAQLP